MTTDALQILIVDDETDICSNMADIFTEFGYSVDVASDGPTAVELIRRRRYDVALLDLMMPGMDGAAVYDEIKKAHAGTVAILVTAYPGHPRAAHALETGVWKIMSKPIDLSRLMPVIEEVAAEPLLLVVDDDTDFCESIWDVLRDRGYRACVANDAATANRLLTENGAYDLVILDMKLPDGDGATVVRTAHQLHRQVPIVLVTGYASEFERDIPQLLHEGAKAVLPKPLEIPRLLKTVEALTGSSAS